MSLFKNLFIQNKKLDLFKNICYLFKIDFITLLKHCLKFRFNCFFKSLVTQYIMSLVSTTLNDLSVEVFMNSKINNPLVFKLNLFIFKTFLLFKKQNSGFET